MAKDSNRYGVIQMQNCKSACDNCKLCQSDTRDNQDCWSNCDKCNRCHIDYKNSQSYDEPYEYRPWFLSKDNHSFEILPYTKQFCDNICGVRMCKKYRKQHNNFTQCKRCQLQGKCWSPYQKRCIDCGYNRAVVKCEDKYGCSNPNGGEFSNVPPINPMFNNCTVCWDQSSYST